MKQSKFETLLDSLQEQGVTIDREAIAKERQSASVRTVFIKVIAVLGGIIGMAMFMGFLFVMFPRSMQSGIVIGIVSLIVSYLFNRSSDGAVKDGLAVSFYISGIITLLIGIGEMVDTRELVSIVSLIAVVLAALSIVIIRNQIIVYLAGVIACIALHTFFVDQEFFVGVNALLLVLIAGVSLLFANENKLRSQSMWWNGYFQSVLMAGFSYGLVLGIICSTQRYMNLYWTDISAVYFITTIGYSLITLGSLYYLLSKQQISSLVVRLGACVVVGVFLYMLGFSYPAFIIGFLFTLWSFNNQSKIGVSFGFGTMVWAMGMFYYDLSMSLLSKSISLMIVGVLFLGVYWLMYKKWECDEK
ncbi:DUF4401 domain-containing protein [Myroides pelagicus]|uniref:DUF4401 domain-containing protein n=1 Tax=Myroides pelagicus TaxID=270914 RepID=A0A7K1GPX0_9FLAO|nr:DUF4401 domain-containing protein [Myroides pelagicus]MTH30599.1 DUF4401 domain-containing protein [Myroides pelagicus]